MGEESVSVEIGTFSFPDNVSEANTVNLTSNSIERIASHGSALFFAELG